ncbi:hypothetical protein BH11ARM2_BH11ARM2_08440 [soil metagenome]
MVPFPGLTLAFLPLQANETYVCRNIRPSRALAAFSGQAGYNDRRLSVAKGEGIFGKVEADANDDTQTIRLRGDQYELDQSVIYFQSIDNQRVMLEGTIRITSPVDGVDSKINASLRANMQFDVAEEESESASPSFPARTPTAPVPCTLEQAGAILIRPHREGS